MIRECAFEIITLDFVMNININNNHIISKVENVKYLGVVLDDKLSWNSHIFEVNKQIYCCNLSGGVALIV